MDSEQAPLLDMGAVLPSAAKEPRQWRGSWYWPAGDDDGCSAVDAAACCLAFNAPHVAFGWNASRGLGLTWWKEALKLLLLTCGALGLVRLVLTVLVHTQCHPHPPHGAMMPHGMEPMMMKHALPGAAGAAVGSEPFVPNNLRGHWAGDATADKVSTATQTSQTTEAEMPVHSVEETDPGMVASIAQIDVMVGPDANQAVDHILERDNDDDDDDDDEDDDDDDDDDGEAFMREFWHHHGPHDDHFHHHHGMPFMSDDEIEECVIRIAPAASVAIAFGIAVAIYAAYFAALRRRMLREKFGIEGSFRGDWLLWLFCWPCALTQETRTLMHNNVEEGLWHGPLSVPRQAVPMSA